MGFDRQENEPMAASLSHIARRVHVCAFDLRAGRIDQLQPALAYRHLELSRP
jgi:hypothetical protein